MLWFLAGNSLNPYIEQYTAEFNKKYPSVHLTIGSAAIDHSQGQATTDKATIALVQANQQEQAVSLVLNNALFFYDVKSFRKEAVVVKQLVIEEANIIVNKGQESADIQALNQALTSILATEHEKIDYITGVLGKPEPLVHLQGVKFKTLFITYYKNGEPEGEQIFRDIEIELPENKDAISRAFMNAMMMMLTASNSALQTDNS